MQNLSHVKVGPFLADNGHFDSWWSDRRGEFAVGLSVVGRVENKRDLKFLRLDLNNQLSFTFSEVCGSRASELASWTISRDQETLVVSAALLDKATDHPRYPVIVAWSECLALAPQQLRAHVHAKGRTYHADDWTDERDAARDALLEAQAEYPPLTPFLPADFFHSSKLVF